MSDTRTDVGDRARELTRPPAAVPDSFVLHAPLELMARAELLAHVEPAARPAADERIADIVDEWRRRAPHVGEPPPAAPAASLGDAIAAGDVDAADAAFTALADRLTVAELVRAAGDVVLPYLGGAAHQAIFLDLLGRLDRPSAARMGRALVRDLARHPTWRLEWVDERPGDGAGTGRALGEVLAGVTTVCDPGSTFIYPTMHAVDSTGLAAEVLAGPVSRSTVDRARRDLLRVAALSMLLDDPAHAPYGWSHCLTMPLSTLAIAERTADPGRVVAIAATYVLGFRATQSAAPIDLRWRPNPPRSSAPLLDGDADEVVARAWHSTEPGDVVRRLATFAATHGDAHLAKYTLACLHARAVDPDHGPLYLAAAARLAAWWREHDAGVSRRR